MRNFALNEFRKSNTRHRLFDRVVEVMTLRTRNPEQEYETRERQQLVVQMLDNSVRPARCAIAMRTRAIEPGEIGQVLNVSESKVKIDISLARTALRESWKMSASISCERQFSGNCGDVWAL